MIRRRRSLYANLLLAIFLLGLLLPGGIAQAAASSEESLTSQFKDVGNDSSNLVYINYMNARGILGGFPDGSFRPDEGLTRAQAAVIISKAVNLNVSTGEASGFT
ncbi:MAG: S-layer homology domain-containing protein, partial [Deltaproteobacteria bacterium]